MWARIKRKPEAPALVSQLRLPLFFVGIVAAFFARDYLPLWGQLACPFVPLSIAFEPWCILVLGRRWPLLMVEALKLGILLVPFSDGATAAALVIVWHGISGLLVFIFARQTGQKAHHFWGEWRWLQGAGLVGVLQSQMDRIFLPLLKGSPESVGWYSNLSFRIPFSSFLYDSVCAKLLADIHDGNIKAHYRRAHDILWRTIVPAILIQLAVGDKIFIALCTDKYTSIAPWYCVAILATFSDCFVSNIYWRAKGDGAMVIRLTTACLIVNFIFIGFFVFRDQSPTSILLGEVLGLLAINGMYAILNWKTVGAWLPRSTWMRALGAGLAGCGAAYFLRPWLSPWGAVGAVAVIYFVIQALVNRDVLVLAARSLGATSRSV